MLKGKKNQIKLKIFFSYIPLNNLKDEDKAKKNLQYFRSKNVAFTTSLKHLLLFHNFLVYYLLASLHRFPSIRLCLFCHTTFITVWKQLFLPIISNLLHTKENTSIAIKIIHTFFIAEVIRVFPHQRYTNIYNGGEKEITRNNFGKFHLLA